MKVNLTEVNNEKPIQLLSEKYMDEHWDELDKDEVSMYQNMSIRFLLKHEDDINWKLYSTNPFISIDTIDFFKDKISWVNICINGKITSPNVIYNYRDHMVWNILLNKQQLELQLLIILSEIYRVNPAESQAKEFWKAVSRYQDFDLEYAAEYGQYIDWKLASHNELLNELVYQGFLDKLDILAVVKTRSLSEDFLMKNAEFLKDKLGI